MSFKLPARPVTSGCVAFGERVVMVCVTDRDDRITRHNSWRHAGGWHCANCAAVIQPGVPQIACSAATTPPTRPAAAARTLGRWLHRFRLVPRKPRHQRRGPQLPPRTRTVPARPNDVWTIDFKGWYRTGDGTRVEPLTVRDLKSRFLLDIRLLPNQSEVHVHRALLRVFRHYGLPKAIWVDNGPPFGGVGPLGYSRLAAWWRRLGIRVEYGRPAHPQDNAAHQQMHGVYQIEVAAHPAIHPPAGQRQSNHWRNI